MEIIVLQVFVSLMLVTGSILLFIYSTRTRDYEHADRLALFPIENDDALHQDHDQKDVHAIGPHN